MTSTQIVLFALTSLLLAQGYADDSSTEHTQTALEDRANEFADNVDSRGNDFREEVERQSAEASRNIQDRVDDSLRNITDTLEDLEASGVNTSGCVYVVSELGTELVRNPTQCLAVKVEEGRAMVETFRDIAGETRSAVRNAAIGTSVCGGAMACTGEVISKAMIKLLLQNSRLAALVTRATVFLGTFQFSVGGCVTAALADSPILVTRAGDELAVCISNSIDDTPPTTPPPTESSTESTTETTTESTTEPTSTESLE